MKKFMFMWVIPVAMGVIGYTLMDMVWWQEILIGCLFAFGRVFQEIGEEME